MAICSGAAVRETTASGEIIYVFGDIDQHNAAELNDALESALCRSLPITVDLTRCRYIGSAGLRALLRAQRRAVRFRTLVLTEGVAARLLEISKVEDQLGVQYVAQADTGSIDSVHQREDVHLIALEGEWDLSRGSDLRWRLERAIAHPRVIFDLSNCTYIDSSCIGMLVRMRTQRVARGYEPARLVLPAGQVQRVLGLAGAHMLWTICDSLGEALQGWKYTGNISVADPT